MSKPIHDLAGRTFGRLTALRYQAGSSWLCRCECGTEKLVRTGALTTGFTTSCGCRHRENLARRNAKGDDITYIGAHLRTQRVRGKASTHQCVDCGLPAQDWSLKSSPSRSLSGQASGGYECRYSPEPFDYEPRCKPCHAKYDRLTRHQA